MVCAECDISVICNADNLVRIKEEREKLTKRLEGLSTEWDKFEMQKKQMKVSLEEGKDPELDPNFPRMIERGLMRVAGKQYVLKKRREELIKRLKELELMEKQMKAVLEHEKYPELLELKKKRDEAAEEVARLDNEMKQLMERMTLDIS